MKKTIVCATDFSEPATRMTDAAAAIAAKLNEPLLLVHVVESSHAADETLSDSLRTAASHRLRAEAERLRQTGLTVEEELLEGPAYEAILSLAERYTIRLTVLASQKKRGLPGRWFFGGVAERVIKNSRVPTLIVRDAAILENWLSGKKPLRVFVAANLSSIPDVPLLWVKELAAIAPCEITVVYLNWVPDESLRLGLVGGSVFEGSRQLQSILENELREKVTRLLGELPVRIKVEPRWGRADLPLVGLAELSDTDLFVVGTRLRQGISRFFDESVSTDILHQAPMAVAVIPLLETVVDAPLPTLDRVLVPTDFSDPANYAIPYACSIVAPGGTVYLAHIIDRFGVEESEALKQLTVLIPPQAAAKGIRFEPVVWKSDFPEDGIRHLAARSPADAICMGTHGRSGIARVLLGSTAQAVIEAGNIPVLLVRKPV